MAKYTGQPDLKGSIGNIVIIKRKDQTSSYARLKNGPGKKQMETLDSMERTRENQKEFGGCSKVSKAIRLATYPLRHLADYNVSSDLTGLAKIIQETDTQGIRGQRSVFLSANKDMLPGFSFNKNTLPDTILRTPVSVSISRQTKSTQVSVPRIIANVNLKKYDKNSLLRIIVTLGVTSDFCYNPKHKKYEPFHEKLNGYCHFESTPWFPISTTIEPQSIQVAIPENEELLDTDTLIAGFGIEFGNPLSDNLVTPAKNAGFAKIIAVG